MGNRLYVGNLPFSANEEQIRELFGQNGREVAEVKMITDRDTGQARGFAFVQMSADAEAQAAIQQLDGQTFGGRDLKVNMAKQRESREPRGARGEFLGGDRSRY
jgi:cold-inducible RNA-binding protein